MGKAKRKREELQEVLERVWCYYCERDFDDLKILTDHQKAKHFRCYECNRRLNTIGGLAVHVSQVHKGKITTVENAIDGRQDVETEIFGMEGIPYEILHAHQQRLTEAYFRKEAEWREKTGNPPKGSDGVNPAKKAKVVMETPEEIKKRLAEHKAKRAAEKAGLIAPGSGTGSGDSTPQPAIPTSGTGVTDTPQAQAPPPYTALSTSPLPGYGYGQQMPMPGASPLQGAPPNGLPAQPWSAGPAPPAFNTPYAPPQSPFGYQPPNVYAPDPYQQHQSPAPFVPPPGPPALGPAMNMVLPPQPTTAPGSNTNTALPPLPSGMPQRPLFNAPNYSKDDWQKIREGHDLPPGAANIPQPPRQLGPDRRDPRNSNVNVSETNNNTSRSTDDVQATIDDVVNRSIHGNKQPVTKQTQSNDVAAQGNRAVVAHSSIEQQPIDKTIQQGNKAAAARPPSARILRAEALRQGDGRMYDSDYAPGGIAYTGPSSSSPINGERTNPQSPPNSNVPTLPPLEDVEIPPGYILDRRISDSPLPTGPKAEQVANVESLKLKKHNAAIRAARLINSSPIRASENRLSDLSRYQFGRNDADTKAAVSKTTDDLPV